MDWNDLRHVLAVTRTGTLAGAGRAIGVDPTTVGRRVIALERALDTRLFFRTPDGFIPTDAGRVVALKAEEVEALADGVREQLSGHESRIAGTVRISTLDGLIDRFLIPQLPAFLTRYPEVDLTLVSGLETIELSRRDADVALRTHRPTELDAVARKLCDVGIAFYIAKATNFGPAPPVIGLPEAMDGTDFALALRDAFPESRIGLRVDAESHILSAVRAGLGVGMLGCYIGDAMPDLERARPDIIVTEPLLAVSHVDMVRVPRVRAVTDFIEGICQKNAALLAGRRSST